MNIKKFSLSNINIIKTIKNIIIKYPINMDDIKFVIESAGQLSALGANYKNDMFYSLRYPIFNSIEYIQFFIILFYEQYNYIINIFEE